MLKRRGSIPALTAIVLGLMAAVAPAHTKTFPTTITSLTVQEGSRSTVVLISGQIDSKNNACAKGVASGSFSVEVSRRGTLFKVQVEKSNLPGKRKHRHKCGRVTKHVSGP